ncbi:XRE family transcriptional regulator [Marinobacter sp. M3C]|uniref:helix-turn-helix domain-containing protein n=1 Tax=Marinobacter sp. M3C TaxID=2917715 RepID=UPI00200BC04D|nr:XRE family transcriptional regulator [Marinobacter sp. M3C]UQG58738.1 XRE family transcriptional regulator [Marinobacter sp. M3C]
MSTAYINTDMLIWARKRSGVGVPEFARKCAVTEERLQEWESGQRAITFAQAMRYADKAHVPFGYLFLAEPPQEELLIPDLRTLGGQGVQRPSAELLDLVKLMLQRQEWYRDYLQQQFAEPNPMVGRFSASDSVDTIVQDMRALLDVPEHPTRGKWDDYYRELVGRIESIGIMVIRQSNLRHHTRPLNVDEFRGFAIVDEYAPVIFINHGDALGARLFTLIHELCHIWIGQSGISDGNPNTHRQEEILCNAVAAEFLVPKIEFCRLWQQDVGRWEDNLPALEAHFHVSTWTLARRALTLGFISEGEYSHYIAEQKAAYRRRESSGGPTYYKTNKAQISRQFSHAVVSEALSGQMLLRDAGELLGGMQPAKIHRFAEELGI